MTALLPLLLPVLGAALASLAGGRRGAVVVAALAGTLATFIAALFLPGAAPFDRPWLPGLGVSFSLDPGGAASVLVVVVALVMVPTALVAALTVEERPGRFVAWLLLAQAGLAGIFMARDMLLFYVFWEGTLVPSLLLLGAFGLERRRAATLKYLTYAVAGSFVMLVTILALKALSGAATFALEDLALAARGLPAGTQAWLFAGLALGMAVKLPLWPLHSWLVDLNEQNHPSGAADVLGTLYKVGGYGFFAWALPVLPLGAERLAPLFIALGAFTAVYGAVVATSQTHLKRLLAYASLSHMGIVAVGVFGLHVAGLNGAVYLLAAQMLSTGGLFVVSGMLYARRRSFDVDAYGGIAKSAPALAALTLFLVFAFIGVPGLANFPGEFLSLLGAYQTSPAAAVVATLAVIGAGVYGVNVYQRLFLGQQREPVRDLGPVELYVLVPFVAGVLWLGLAPAAQLERIEAQSQVAVVQLAGTEPPADELALGGAR
ncbi:MAG TPA: NADH-quinone oxidoreductase subunit M [Trueperaceae bacterium]|nr:NADH-quinone oxidoreductase subunit M [Trueperaceae bacterium]